MASSYGYKSCTPATAAAICCYYSRPNDYTFRLAVLRNCATIRLDEADLFVN